MAEYIVATVYTNKELLELFYYERMGFVGYTPNTMIHIVGMLYSPEDEDEKNRHLKSAFKFVHNREPLPYYLKVISMPGYAFFDELVENRFPKDKDLQILGDVPLRFHEVPDFLQFY